MGAVVVTFAYFTHAFNFVGRRSTATSPRQRWHWPAAVLAAVFLVTAGCGGDSNPSRATQGSPALINGQFPIVYVKRPAGAVGNPSDGVTFAAGGDLFLRSLASASAPERNITARYTQGKGDVADPEASFDGRRVVFSMKGPSDATWNIWEYEIATDTLRRVIADDETANRGDDVDPAYLPDGRIVFASNRQNASQAALQRAQVQPYVYVDEYEREPAIVLHIMNADGAAIRQISANQSHDRNPTVLSTGEIMYSRWEHVGPRNQFPIFFANPDGTTAFVLYGAHSPGEAFLQPREMQDGRIISTLMPVSGTHEGGALVVIDVKNFSDNDTPIAGAPAGAQGQRQVTARQIPLEGGLSQYGRYTTPFPLWDGTNRALVSWTPSQPSAGRDPLSGDPTTVEGMPVYGVYMLDLGDKTMRLLVPAPLGYAVTDAIAVAPRNKPNIIEDKPLDTALAQTHQGILNVKSVYDTDRLERMGSAVLAAGESIPLTAAPAGDERDLVADLALLKDPNAVTAANRAARFVRVSRAVPMPAGLSRQIIGASDFEPQQLLGYAQVEPDGSFKVKVPADTALAVTVTDSQARGFTPHTSWLNVQAGETRSCNGCHSPRRGSALNVDPIAGNHPALFGIAAPGVLHVHPGASVSSVLHADDPEGDVLTYRIVTQPTQGTVLITDALSGDFTYTANTTAAVGQDFFTFVANDGTSDSNEAMITVNIHEPPSANRGESMAETRVRYFPEVAELQADPVYQDVWGPRANPCLMLRYTGNTSCVEVPLPNEDLTTAVPRDGFINYPEHIQPLFNKDRGANTCILCHNSSDSAVNQEAGLDLRDTVAGTGRLTSYESLLVGSPVLDATGHPTLTLANGRPEIQRSPALVVPGASRSSYLVEKLSGQELLASRELDGTLDHSDFLNRAEKRLLAEWIDLGAQYYNDPFGADSNGNGTRDLSELRNSARGLDIAAFAEQIQPVFARRCVACHEPRGSDGGTGQGDTPRQFVLTGNLIGDYNVTVSMVSDLRHPAANPLLQRPASDGIPPNVGHPVISAGAAGTTPVLSLAKPADERVADDYNTILQWIDAARIANGL
jgi:hypothetical protein